MNISSGVPIVDSIISYVATGSSLALKYGVPFAIKLYNEQTDLVTILMLVIVLYLSVLILSHTTRLLFNMVLNIVKLFILLGAIVIGLWAYVRGPQEAWLDLLALYDYFKADLSEVSINIDKTNPSDIASGYKYAARQFENQARQYILNNVGDH